MNNLGEIKAILIRMIATNGQALKAMKAKFCRNEDSVLNSFR